MAATVSVIVPNYNYGQYLDERLRSLLSQTFSDFELIVVDDASTDNSRDVIERHAGDPRLRAQWHDARSDSTYQRWNDGAALAAGRYLLFAGADDSCAPEMLATLVAGLNAHPDAGLAYVRSRVIDTHGNELSVSPSHPRWDSDFISDAIEELPYILDQKMIPTASGVMIRRELFERCGGFDTSFRLAADHLLWVRALRTARVVYRAQPLNYFRTHDGTVRARLSRADTVRERYRLFGFVFDAFAVGEHDRERVRERLALNWLECWSGDTAPQRLARQRPIARAASAADPQVFSRIARIGIERATGVRVRTPRAVAAYAWRRLQDERYLLRGRRILWHYSSHYRAAQRAYRRTADAAPIMSVRDIGVHVCDGSSPIELPALHREGVDRLAAAVDRALALTAHCRFVPQLASGAVPERTAAVGELANGALIAIQLRDPLTLDALHDVCEPLMDQLERKLYGSFALVDKVYAYRSPISRQAPRASWLWHFDNHPREMLKVMIYLTDVTAETAPFEYLRSRATGLPVMGSPLAPLHHHSRIAPTSIEQHLSRGCEVARVTGARGTVLIFDDNVIHRGTLAQAGHRDVVVFQVRPSILPARPRIDPRWTGSFLHHDVNRDPFELAPRLRAESS